MVQFTAFKIHYRERAFPVIEGGHYRVPDAFPVISGRFETVDDKLDEMRLVSVKLCDFRKFADFAVDTDLGVPALAELVEEFLVVSFPSFDQRSQEIAFLSVVVLHDEIYDLLVGIADHFLACGRGVCPRCLGIQEPQEVVDFSDGSDSGARIVPCGFLFDGYYRAEPGYAFYLRFLENAHELFGVCGESIHISPLPFCVNGVECQGRFSAAAQSCDHHEAVAGDGKRHSFQVVRPGSAYFYIFCIVVVHIIAFVIPVLPADLSFALRMT